jgi:hypothetical protein
VVVPRIESVQRAQKRIVLIVTGIAENERVDECERGGEADLDMSRVTEKWAFNSSDLTTRGKREKLKA